MNIPLHEALRDLTVVEYLGVLFPQWSRRRMDELLAGGEILDQGVPVAADEVIGDLQELTLTRLVEDVTTIFSAAASAASDPLPAILHEDSRIIVLSKPAGVPVVPDRTKSIASCLEFLVRRELEARPRTLPSDWIRPRIVHRLDRFTSGLVIVARTAAVERKLNADFEGRRIGKEYLAIVQGIVEPARITVDCAIGPGRKGRMRAVPSGGDGPAGSPKKAKDALTVFEVIQRLESTTLVRALPRTGRTHQIRVHAWAMGHPLAVDPLYRVGRYAAAPVDVPGVSRLTLHAHRYTLPQTWSPPRTFTCPLAGDLAAALRGLGWSDECGMP